MKKFFLISLSVLALSCSKEEAKDTVTSPQIQMSQSNGISDSLYYHYSSIGTLVEAPQNYQPFYEESGYSYVYLLYPDLGFPEDPDVTQDFIEIYIFDSDKLDEYIEFSSGICTLIKVPRTLPGGAIYYTCPDSGSSCRHTIDQHGVKGIIFCDYQG